MANPKDEFIIVTTATTAQAFDENVIAIKGQVLLQNTNSQTLLTPVTGSPGTTQVQFTGTAQTPTSGLTFNTAPAAGNLIIAKVVPSAGNPTGA